MTQDTFMQKLSDRHLEILLGDARANWLRLAGEKSRRCCVELPSVRAARRV
jgi:hypothetical protein